jgi:putative glutamine amidotransferase
MIKAMKSVLCFFLLLFFLKLTAQDFFRENFDKSKTYILLANPTSANIETVKFLTKQKLLKVNPKNVRFVGVYHENQNYDFNEIAQYIKKDGLNNFYLHEFRGPMNENKLFGLNDLSEEIKHLFEHSAGIFFFGGPDIQPSMYGEENTLSVVTDPERHNFEATFLFHLLGGYQNEDFKPFLNDNPDYLVTGFCLGLQTMNVATGGTLIQDIPEEVYGASTPEATLKAGKENLHRNYWQKISNDEQLMGINFHTIKFTENPFFEKKVKVNKNLSPLVYSSHHQAVEKRGKGMEVTAWSSDGKIVEGLAHSNYPHVFSVQFHPEVPALYENRETFKFKPDDTPQTYHRILGKESGKFHKNYWKYISKALKEASR